MAVQLSSPRSNSVDFQHGKRRGCPPGGHFRALHQPHSLESHTSYVLQPLDVSVFSSYKSLLQREMYSPWSGEKLLDAFDIAACINAAYNESLTYKNIIMGFERTGLWDSRTLSASIAPLLDLCRGKENNGTAGNLTMEQLIQSFSKQGRSLLRDADVTENDTVRVSTRTGSHLTSNAVLSALECRGKRRLVSARNATARACMGRLDYKESADDIRRLVALPASRALMKQQLKASRSLSRKIAARRSWMLHSDISEM